MLLKVTNDGLAQPLDVNDNLCSQSGLPQFEKSNEIGTEGYISPVFDTSSCPISATPIYCSTWNSGVNFEGVIDFAPGTGGQKTINNSLSTGQINSYTVNGEVVYEQIPFSFSSYVLISFSKLDLNALVTQFEFTVNLVWNEGGNLALTSQMESLTGSFEGCTY